MVRRGSAAYAIVFVGATMARDALAEDCLDASDRARAAMGERRLLRARTALRECARDECDEAVRATCGAYLSEVNERLPTVVFDVKDRAGRDVVATIAADGTPAKESPGAEMVLDPGPHTFVFAASGVEPVERSFILLERQKGRREAIVLGPDPSPTPLRVDPQARATEPRWWRTAGYVGLGASAVAFGIGAAFGIDAILKNDRAGCDAANVCDEPASRSAARDAASVSTSAFVISGVLALASVVVLVVERRPSRKALGSW